jgi:hypothetical protein
MHPQTRELSANYSTVPYAWWQSDPAANYSDLSSYPIFLTCSEDKLASSELLHGAAVLLQAA